MSETNDPSPEELLAVATEMASSFPPPRAGTELVILDVHPHRAHAFWHVDGEDFRAAQALGGSSDPQLVIRLHDVTGIDFDGRNPHDTFDTLVAGLEGQADLNVWRDGRTYLGELGFRRPDGKLAPLAVSERFEMPRAPKIHLPMVAMPDTEEQDAPVLEEALVLAPPPPVVVAVGPWPSAEELLECVPERAEAVEEIYSLAEPMPSPITIAQQTMELEVRDVPPVVAGDLEAAAAVAMLPAEPLPVPAALASLAAAGEPLAIRIEDYLSHSSHSLGRLGDGVEVFVDIAIRGRVPAGRKATLFGQPVPVDAEGRFEFRQEIQQPAAVLAHVWRSTVSPRR